LYLLTLLLLPPTLLCAAFVLQAQLTPRVPSVSASQSGVVRDRPDQLDTAYAAALLPSSALFHCRHNSHHAFPQSARHGLEWYEIDLTWYVICTLKALGIVWDVHVPSEKAKALKRVKPAPIKLTAKAH
jgi:hypothetical protein